MHGVLEAGRVLTVCRRWNLILLSNYISCYFFPVVLLWHSLTFPQLRFQETNIHPLPSSVSLSLSLCFCFSIPVQVQSLFLFVFCNSRLCNCSLLLLPLLSSLLLFSTRCISLILLQFIQRNIGQLYSLFTGKHPVAPWSHQTEAGPGSAT